MHGQGLDAVERTGAFDYKLAAQASLLLWEQARERPAIFCPSLQVLAVLGLDGPAAARVSAVCPERVEVDTSEEFLFGCSLAAHCLLDLVCRAALVETFVFLERPLGLSVVDARVVAVAGAAERLGVTPGSVVRGVGAEDDDADLVQQLASSPMPLALLAEPPPSQWTAEVAVLPIKLRLLRLTAGHVAVEETELELEGLHLPEQRSTALELAGEVAQGYMERLMRHLPQLLGGLRLFDRRLSDAAANSVGSLLFALSSGPGLPSALGGLLAEGLADVTAASLRRSRELRAEARRPEDGADDGGEGGPQDRGYRFGDLTRGLVALAGERGRRASGTFSDHAPGPSGVLSGAADVAAGSVAGVADFAARKRN